jgi:predicted SnoaL-like aldol condensation-catalyzing enzyme
MRDLERNKANVVAFYDLLFNQGRPQEALERYVGADFVEHSPHVPPGKEGFVAYFERMAREHPGKSVVFKRVIAEGDLVALHCRQTWRGGYEYASMDIFRLASNGKIVEHWDVLQVVPQNSANPTGMF